MRGCSRVPTQTNTFFPVLKHEGEGGLPGGIFQLKWLRFQKLKALGDQKFSAQGTGEWMITLISCRDQSHSTGDK